MSKYNAKKVVIDGITFDSAVESYYYEYLKELKAKEKILNFELQPKYELISKFKKDGKQYQGIKYKADFIIYHLDGSEEVIDVKGMATPEAKMKRKLFNYKYHDLKLTWLCRSKKYSSTGWIEYDELEKLKRLNKKKVS
jgi:hypothetical protein